MEGWQMVKFMVIAASGPAVHWRKRLPSRGRAGWVVRPGMMNGRIGNRVPSNFPRDP